MKDYKRGKGGDQSLLTVFADGEEAGMEPIPTKKTGSLRRYFLTFKEAQESIPKNRFR
jgi:hypothetical protein